MSSRSNWVQSLQPWSTSMAAWGRVTRPCSSSLSVSMSWLHLLQTWCRLMVASFCIMSSGQSLGLQETWLQASAFDWPLPSCLQEAPSAKDHERTRRGRAKEVRLTPNTPFHAEKLFSTIPRTRICSTAFYAAIPIPLVNKLDCVVTHDEADITLCSYMLKAAAEDAQTIRILSDDTDVLVLLVYWTSRMRIAAKIQMEKWNGDVLDIDETVRRLGPRKYNQLLGNHALSVRYSVIPLWERKAVSAQAPRDRYTRSRSSVRTAWRDPHSAPGDSIHHRLTPLRTKELYNNELCTCSLLPWP